MSTKVQIEGGAFQNEQGVVVALGTLVLQLSQDAQVVSPPSQVNDTPITVNLDSNGNVPASPSVLIWGNDQLVPSGTVYSARVFDATGALVWGPQLWSLSGAGPIDLGTLTPTSSGVSYPNAVLKHPSADQTIDQFNLLPALGNTTQSLGSSSAPWDAVLDDLTIKTRGNLTNSGNYVSGTNEYLSSLLNNININTELGGSPNATIALTGGSATPAGATVTNSIGVGGFANSMCDSMAGTVGNAVGLYGLGRAIGNNAAVWGGNFLAQDTASVTGALLTGAEIDIGVIGSPAQFRALSFFGVGAGTPPVYPNSYWIGLNALSTGGTPQIGLQSNRGAVSVTGILLDGLSNSNNTASQRIAFNGYDGGGTQHQAVIQCDAAGNIQLIPATSQSVSNTGALSLGGKITTYNNVSTAGSGVAAVYGATSQKSESAADTNVLTFTPPASAGTYRINFTMAVSAQNTATLGWTATWKDSNGQAQAPTNLSLFTSGTAAPALTVTAATNGVYYGQAIVDVDNSATNIVVKLTFTGTSFAAKASATIERLI